MLQSGVVQLGRLPSRPEGRTGKSGKPAGSKACPTLAGANRATLNFGIQASDGGSQDH
jgi:hypothetical protein